MPQPWREGQSLRGRKKASRTRGFACDNRACVYYGITGPTIHALVADGHHTCTGAVPKGPARCQCGKHERIQDLKCQACGHKFTVCRHTVLYRLNGKMGCIRRWWSISLAEREKPRMRRLTRSNRPKFAHGFMSAKNPECTRRALRYSCPLACAAAMGLYVGKTLV